MNKEYNPHSFNDLLDIIPNKKRGEVGDNKSYYIKRPFPGSILLEKDFPLTFNQSITRDSFEWCVGDTEEDFETRLKDAPEDWKYREEKVNYILNSSGFRAPDWKDVDWGNSIVLLGCSCVYGVGIDDSETLDKFLSKELGHPVINLGVPGGSNELICLILANLLTYFKKPKAICIGWTTTDRAIYYQKGMHYNVGPWDIAEYPARSNVSSNGINRTEQYLTLFLDPYNEIGKANQWGKFAKVMCGDIPEFQWSWFQESAHATRSTFVPWLSEEHDKWAKARDCQHPGTKTMEHTAKALAMKLSPLL